jgi:predicted MPP superfamily phosphohydrolase
MAMTRRHFIKRAAIAAGGASILGGTYSALEAGWIRIAMDKIVVRRLPPAFAGMRVALLTDIHHGPWTSLSYVQYIVETVNSLSPDLILLGGDYVHCHRRYIAPCFQTLGGLRAKFGVYGVLGNHDHVEGETETKLAMKSASIVELTNTGVWLTQSGSRLRLCGVGDLWMDKQDLAAALDDATAADCAMVLSHNPDVAEYIRDPRASMVLSGHTHGGQVVLPLLGAPFVPSRFGSKYLRGLVQAPKTSVFVSRGLGTITPPVRFCCRPEINLLTLA